MGSDTRAAIGSPAAPGLQFHVWLLIAEFNPLITPNNDTLVYEGPGGKGRRAGNAGVSGGKKEEGRSEEGREKRVKEREGWKVRRKGGRTKWVKIGREEKRQET